MIGSLSGSIFEWSLAVLDKPYFDIIDKWGM